MALIKKYSGRLMVLMVIGFAAFFALKYFGLRSRLAETEYSRNRVKAALNAAYYRKIRPIEQTIGEDPTPDKIRQWRQETEKKALLEQLMYGDGNPSLSTPDQPASANLENFRVEALGNEQWDVQLDARQEWANTYIAVQGGDEIEFVADKDSLACPGLPDPCAGPNGQMGLAKNSHFQPEQFPVGDAMFQALVARIGKGTPFQVGQYLKYRIPTGVSGTVRLMSNIRLPYLHLASGGHRLLIKVSRSQ